MGKDFPYGYVIGAVVVAFLLYFFRPWFHGIILGLYTNPMFVVAVIFGILALYLRSAKASTQTLIIVSSITIIAVILQLASPLIIQLYLVNSYEPVIIDQLIESTNPRVVPMAVAQRFGTDSLQKSRERLGDFDPIMVNGTQYWVSPRIPNSPVLYFIQKVQGVLLVNAESESRQTRLIDQEFKFGENIGIFDNIYWQLYKQKYLANIDEIYYIYHNEEFKLVAPYITYRFRFPVMVPQFGGVFVVSADGKISQYEPHEIPEFLQESRVFPASLARLKVESYKYNNGVWNAWFIHEDQIEITDLPGQTNHQPFLLDTVEGLKWVIATEPFGDSRGVFKIFFVDAVTGEIKLYELDTMQTLTGPIQVVSFAVSQFPLIDWTASRIIEPRPYIQNGELYWMLSIVARDYAGISQTIFVNAADNTVYQGNITRPIRDTFIAGNETISSVDTRAIEQKITDIESLLDELRRLLDS